MQAGGEVKGGFPAGGAKFFDGGGGVEDIARPGGRVADFGAEAGEGEDEFGQAQDRYGVAGGDVVDPGEGGGEGGVLEGGGDIIDIDEVTGLMTVAEDGERGAGAGGLEEFGDGGGVGPAGILTGAVDVEKPEGDRRKLGFGAQFFPGEFGFGVRAGGSDGGDFRFWHGGFIAIDGTGTGKDKSAGAGLGGSSEDAAGAFHVDFLAAGGMGDGFGNTDEGSKVKHMGGAGTGLGERGGIENGSRKKSTVETRQIFFFTGGEVVEDGDGAAGGEPAHEMAADEAGAAGN